MRIYGRMTCRFCGKTIKTAGIAKFQHFRGHMRRTFGSAQFGWSAERMEGALAATTRKVL